MESGTNREILAAMSEGIVQRGVRVRSLRLNSTRRHRTVGERIFLRFPTLARAILALRQRLPLRSRLRRVMLVRLTEMATAAANRRDFDLLLTGFHPDIDLLTEAGVYPPGLTGHQHGHRGYRASWHALMEVFDDLTLEPAELIDLGDHVISVTRAEGRGTGSGVPVSMTFFQIFTFRDGLVISQADVQTLERALEVAKLSE